MDDIETLKRRAGEAAAGLVRSGTVVGLGTGSTARYVIAAIGRALADGTLTDVSGVPTSAACERMAREAGIPLVELGAAGVDIAIDGADEIDPALEAIKGLGGAMTREKIVAAAARRFVLVADATKRVERLGERAPVPVEVLRFGWRRTAAALASLGCTPRLRGGEAAPALTDNGHPVLDCAVPAGFDAAAFAAAVDTLPGVVGTGLFLGLARTAFIAGDGDVVRLERGGAAS
ncbi:MAG: ribose-5-phosphate isomerase RpiA [Trueperaceae bacterium]|nr:MAG: ribose-5-phosphate isomerase RpiA [Trueperaceae bacterium]